MTAAGERTYERDKHKSGLYAYEKPLASLNADEEKQFRRDTAAGSLARRSLSLLVLF